jgi:putative ABC transport system permease protein
MGLSTLIDIFQVAVLVGLLYSLFTIGLSISFRVLNYPDLTLEGSVIFGGALSFVALKSGLPPFPSLIIGALGGAIAGAFTGIQYLYLGISKLLSGIITTAVLYSINIRLLGGKANVRFENINGIFDAITTSRSRSIEISLLAFIVLAIIFICYLLFTTKLGLLLRVVGDNESFIVALGQNPKVIILTGLVIANTIVGLGGAVLIQYKNTCDVNMSFGLLIGAFAAMVLGETFLQARTIWHYLASNIAGTITYNLAIALVLFSWNSNWEKLIIASDVRLVTGLLLIIPTILRNKGEGRFMLFKSEW